MTANMEIARLLLELASLTEFEEGDRQSFRARAYHNAVRAIEAHPGDVTVLSEDELVAIRGVGKAIAKKVREFAATGHIAKLDELRAKFPPGYLDLVRIPGVGPKTIALLREHLGVTTVDELKSAVAAGRLADVPGLGRKTEENLARDIERLGLIGKERRTPIIQALPLAEEIVAFLERVPSVQRAAYAGSLRRFRETIGDVDVVAAASEPSAVINAFTRMAMVREVAAGGDKKVSVVTYNGVQLDLRVVAPQQWGAALLYFTGSHAHNVRVRERAVRRGWRLNEYGLFEEDTSRLIASATEAEIYAALDMAWVPPGLREDRGECEAATAGTLPVLASESDIVGDLHVHTDLSGDGRNTLEEMVEAAAASGLRYMAITDHAENLRFNGVSRRAMLAQRARIADVGKLYPEITLLHGAELNIGPEGELDYDREFLLSFDWCVASVHSHFNLDQAQQTKRILNAMVHPAVSAVGHLQGRRIGKRRGIDLDVASVLDAASETGTAIEINSHLDRLDAASEVLWAARDRDVVFVVNSDAHRVTEFKNRRYGVLQAERGWVAADRIANTWEPVRFLSWATSKRRAQ
ncbi:MAG: DNA polymerase/3'-5' exonuclease PolX [Actinomycetota bacterium]|nr:DNA polymerase/3'-5' exonuclease PolX [Actinomycetota bacterium]